LKNKNVLLGIVYLTILILTIILAVKSIRNFIDNINYAKEIEHILSDGREIEKKWLIDKNKIPYDLTKAVIMKIEQTYICFSPEIRVRRINDGKQYSFALKMNMTSDGMIRDEMENYITQQEYENLIKKQEGNTVYKTRYQFLDGENLLAIDIFSGDLDGLAYLEIEFENEEEANTFETPDWVIKDVTGDVNYKNGYLARYGIPNSFYEYTK